MRQLFKRLLLRQVLLSLSMFFCFTNVWSQFEDIVFEDHVYNDYIKTVQFAHRNVALSFPIIDLNSSGVLRLEFDDMEGEFRNYLYKIIHCDKDWNPSDLEEIEYIDGFNDEEIDGFGYSTNGYSDYTHYTLDIPNDDITWTISGNYLLLVTDEDLEIPVLSRRFVVTENEVNVIANTIRPQNTLKYRTHQELELKINYGNFRISRPQADLFVTIIQNGNWHTAQENIKGTFERGQELIFDQYDLITFPGLKEFTNFDTRPLHYRTQYVRRINQTDNTTYVTLDTMLQRRSRNYIFEPDANGGFIIDNELYDEPDVSSEYAQVNFALFCRNKSLSDVYVVGAFSDWKAKQDYRMSYDELDHIYSLTAPFKQGYYDFIYAGVDEDGNVDLSSIEGDWFETENDYQIIVYYRDFTAQYDRVLDIVNFSSVPK